MNTLTLNIPPSVNLTDEQFYQLCVANQYWKLELSAKGELIIMPPTGGSTGNRNSELNLELGLWNRQQKLGIVFDSSTCFQLPNEAKLSPDAAWIPLIKWQTLTPEQQDKFPPLCPDFIVELRSPSDSLKDLREKMQDYINNGSRLGWLINRQNRQVEIYRSGKEPEILDNPTTLSGEEVLLNFILDLSVIW
jgi:Uma2 family endonuclease